MPETINRRAEMVPVEKLFPHPRNPRQGDVGAIAESIRLNGFYGVLVAQESSGHVLVGNHRLAAAREVGMAEVPVVFVDVDDEQAVAILLADNRTSDLAAYDNGALADLLTEIAAIDRLPATGWTAENLDALLADIGQAAKFVPQDTSARLDQTTEIECPECGAKFSR